MTPRRLVDQHLSEGERLLLQSMREEQPPKDSEARALAALGLSAGVSVGGAAVAKKGALLLKLGITCAVAVLGVALVVKRPSVSPKPTAIAPNTIVASAPPMSASAPASVVPSVVEPIASASVIAPPPVVSAPPRPRALPTLSLTEETALVDDARAALLAGDVARARGLLLKHDRLFPNGVLAPESDLLQVEALVRLGQHDAALVRADALEAKMPGSSYAKRARALVEKE